ncbi:hypothetical protein SG586P1_00033 [Streptococcus phage SG586P1]|nr:hypothetical protein SG586P1_00033 [Streptococcus phage SG586P1]WAX18010.1 hypothetical protein SG586P3_00005 [Streptococcus phage SG586P3]
MKIYLTKNKKLKIQFDKELIDQFGEFHFGYPDKLDIQLLDSVDFKINEMVSKELSQLVKEYLDKLSTELLNDDNSPEINFIIEEKKRQEEERQKQIKKSFDTSYALNEILGGK